jgi:hypothetical protein
MTNIDTQETDYSVYMQPWDEFHESPCISPEKKLTCHQGIIKFPAVMLVLSESFHVFESRIACRCNRFPSRRRRT